MAILHGDLGVVTQKLGGNRFSKWKNKNVIARMPASYNDANTPAQQINRKKMTLLTALTRALLGAIRIGFKKEATEMTEANAFVKFNYPQVGDNGGVAEIEPSVIVVSRGTVKVPGAIAAVNGVNPGEVRLTITDNSDGNTGLTTDKLYVGWLIPATNEGGVINTGKTRTTAAVQFTVALGDDVEGQEVALYPFFKRAANTDCSDNAVEIITV